MRPDSLPSPRGLIHQHSSPDPAALGRALIGRCGWGSVYLEGDRERVQGAGPTQHSVPTKPSSTVSAYKGNGRSSRHPDWAPQGPTTSGSRRQDPWAWMSPGSSPSQSIRPCTHTHSEAREVTVKGERTPARISGAGGQGGHSLSPSWARNAGSVSGLCPEIPPQQGQWASDSRFRRQTRRDRPILTVGGASWLAMLRDTVPWTHISASERGTFPGKSISLHGPGRLPAGELSRVLKGPSGRRCVRVGGGGLATIQVAGTLRVDQRTFKPQRQSFQRKLDQKFSSGTGDLGKWRRILGTKASGTDSQKPEGLEGLRVPLPEPATPSWRGLNKAHG